MSEPFDFSKLGELGEIPDPLSASPPEPHFRDFRSSSDGPDRTTTRRRRWIALALSGAWLGGHLLVFGVRGDLSKLPVAYVVGQIALPFVLAVASLWVALTRGRAGLGARVVALVTLSFVGPVAFWAVATLAPSPRPALAGEASGVRVLLCLDLTLLWTAVPLLCAALVLRHAFPAASRWRSALLAVAAGLLASGVMNLHCPNVTKLHIAVGHGLPILIALVVGAILMPRATRA
ncbi:MAG TPA: NrsF family protein [Polyangiaceae bacterium]|nr:NrsF family protein [Polyangiaceae bacterium]